MLMTVLDLLVWFSFFFNSLITAELEGRSCTPCQPGYRLIQSCTSNEDTICGLCPNGTFQPNPGFSKTCQRCTPCKHNESVDRECSRIEDTVCKCPKNHIYDKFKPCIACPKGTVVVDNVCRNTTQIKITHPSPTNSPKPNQDLVVGLIVAGVAFLVLFILLIFYKIYSDRVKRREQRRRTEEVEASCLKHQVANDVIKDPPDIGPKFMIPKENVYSPVPTTNVFANSTLCGKTLPFSLVYDLECMLAASYRNNYKHLAGQLGYPLAFIKQLEVEQHPVQALLDDYITRENPTKEELYEALRAIGRPDVAKVVKELCIKHT